MNNYRFLKMRVDELGRKNMTQEELAQELKIDRNRIQQLETSPKVIPKDYELRAYRDYFNTTSDYLLGFTDEPSRDENKITASNVTGLNGKSIRTLEALKQSTDIDTINFIMSDTYLFGLFLSCLQDYIEPGFTIPIHPERDKNTININYVENLDIESDSILANKERRIYIGKENGEFNGKPLYDIKGIPVSELGHLNLLRIQEILRIWKDRFEGKE